VHQLGLEEKKNNLELVSFFKCSLNEN